MCHNIYYFLLLQDFLSTSFIGSLSQRITNCGKEHGRYRENGDGDNPTSGDFFLQILRASAEFQYNQFPESHRKKKYYFARCICKLKVVFFSPDLQVIYVPSLLLRNLVGILNREVTRTSFQRPIITPVINASPECNNYEKLLNPGGINRL